MRNVTLSLRQSQQYLVLSVAPGRGHFYLLGKYSPAAPPVNARTAALDPALFGGRGRESFLPSPNLAGLCGGTCLGG